MSCAEMLKHVGDGKLFKIDDRGRIWRIAKVATGKHCGTHRHPIEPRRCESTNSNGALFVRQRLAGKRITVMAHNLVWEHFNGAIPQDKEVCHINGNITDNAPENLELVEKSKRHAKLTTTQVVAIRESFATGRLTKVELAEFYGVTAMNIYKIIVGMSWPEVGGPIVKPEPYPAS